MTKLQNDILALIKSALTKEKVNISADLDWQEIAKVAKEHKIAVLVYYGAYYSGIEIPDGIKAEMTKYVFAMTSYDALQDREIEKISAAFQRAEIAFMPLKGTILKKLYPSPEMRYMGDADILIKEEDYPKISEAMQSLGFEFQYESDHEYVWTKKNVMIELHKHLIPSYNKDYFAYYGSGWQLAAESDGYCYSMKPEDFLIYIFTHLAKHYRDSGIGIKHFVDLWVFKNAHPELDKAYVELELEKLQLLGFFKNSMHLLEVWLGGKEPDAKDDFMTNWIFSSGVYGKSLYNDLSAALKATKEVKTHGFVKIKIFIKELFPTYKSMCKKYAFLKKLPFLLPIMWVFRPIDVLLFKRDNIRKKADKLSNLTEENIDAYEGALDYVGLSFDFKEKDK